MIIFIYDDMSYMMTVNVIVRKLPCCVSSAVLFPEGCAVAFPLSAPVNLKIKLTGESFVQHRLCGTAAARTTRDFTWSARA